MGEESDDDDDDGERMNDLQSERGKHDFTTGV